MVAVVELWSGWREENILKGTSPYFLQFSLKFDKFSFLLFSFLFFHFLFIPTLSFCILFIFLPVSVYLFFYLFTSSFIY